MDNFKLIYLREEDMKHFKLDMQEAFQGGAEDVIIKVDGVILPKKGIDMCLAMKGSAAYQAMIGDDRAGGAIVTIDAKTQHNELGFLFVKRGAQSRGIGQAIWKAIEGLYKTKMASKLL